MLDRDVGPQGGFERPSPLRMLREVMLHAYRTGHYRGTGWDWGYRGDEALSKILEADEYVQVLRSREFCVALFTPPIVAFSHVGAQPPSNLIFQHIPDDFNDRWKKHHEVLRNHPDPLCYCWENMH